VHRLHRHMSARRGAATNGCGASGGDRLAHVLSVGMTNAAAAPVSGYVLGGPRKFGPPAQRDYKPAQIEYGFNEQDATNAMRVLKILVPAVNDREMYLAIRHYIRGDVIDWDETGIALLEKHVDHFWKQAEGSMIFMEGVDKISYDKLTPMDKTNPYITEDAFVVIDYRVRRHYAFNPNNYPAAPRRRGGYRCTGSAPSSSPSSV